MVLCVPNSFVKKHGPNCLEQAATSLELCLSSTDQRWANNFKRIFQRMNLPFHPLYINSYNSICTYVEAGRGAMLDTEFCLSSERARFSTALYFPREKAEALDVLLRNEACKHPILPEFLKLL